ncbi:acyl-CoA N-acyltransferase, partial [Tribonema minus]
ESGAGFKTRAVSVAQRRELVNAANQDPQPSEKLEGDARRVMADTEAQVAFHTAKELCKETQELVFSLLKSNMEDMYISAGWAWDDAEKRNELFSPTSRLLLCTSTAQGDESGKLLGFCHYRFELYSDLKPSRPVLYVYELQLAEGARRKGLGKRLMSIAEAIGAEKRMSVVVLTVFKTNVAAIKLYEGAGYTLDPSDPSKWDRTECYAIMSKPIAAPPSDCEAKPVE